MCGRTRFGVADASSKMEAQQLSRRLPALMSASRKLHGCFGFDSHLTRLKVLLHHIHVSLSSQLLMVLKAYSDAGQYCQAGCGLEKRRACCCRVLSFDVVVQQEDTVDSIARKLGLPREVLLSANGGTALCTVCCLRCT